MRTVLSLIAAALIATPAAAQGAEWRKESPEFARKVLRDFAECAVRTEPAIARRFVMMNDGERLPEAEFRRLFSGRCLGFRGGQLQMRSWQSRSALAEAFIRRQPEPQRPLDFAAAPLDWPRAPALVVGGKVDAEAVAKSAAASEAEMMVSELGECVVRADSAGVLAALATKIDSKAELERFQALTPRIAACVQEGQTMAFNRTNLRSGLALAYYRLTNAAPSAAPVAGAAR